jgi:hypothetical protein
MFRVLVSNLAEPPEEIWCDYNQRVPRGGMEQQIEELKSGLAADDFCLRESFATEAPFLSILILFRLLGEFRRASGMTHYRQRATLRVSRQAGCGAILGRAGHRTVLVASAARRLGEGSRSVIWSFTKACFMKFQLRASWNSNHTRQGKHGP